MLTKQATQEIMEVYYEEGVKLAMAEAGLIKVAKPKKQARSKAVFGRMHDITAPLKQTMHIKKPMKVQPSEMFKSIAKLPKNTETENLMSDYFDTAKIKAYQRELGDAVKGVASNTARLLKNTPDLSVTKKDLSRRSRKGAKRGKFRDPNQKIMDKADIALKNNRKAISKADTLLKDTDALIDRMLNRTK